jgi:hypothetical protein
MEIQCFRLMRGYFQTLRDLIRSKKQLEDLKLQESFYFQESHCRSEFKIIWLYFDLSLQLFFIR